MNGICVVACAFTYQELSVQQTSVSRNKALGVLYTDDLRGFFIFFFKTCDGAFGIAQIKSEKPIQLLLVSYA